VWLSDRALAPVAGGPRHWKSAVVWGTISRMRPWIRSLPLAALSPLIACAPREGDPTGFSSAPGIVTVSSETPSGTTSGGTTSPGGTVASSTTTGDDGSASGSTAPAMFPDLGGIPDLGNPQPLGCKGKIDFLFVISRSGWMASDSEGIGTIYERLVAAIPQFFDTIQTNFADFDYHILVTKGDVHWGDPYCNEECPGPFTEKCWPGDEYPCEMVDEASTCDHTWGAGVVFNAGRNAPNTPCDVAGGRRYLTKDQPNLDETFACVLQVGTSGHDMLGQALTAAVSPELNGPGGCNEGFLRDDALLVVTLVTSHEDPVSPSSCSTSAHRTASSGA
jgi:hypothetical protein